jgi:hypothetical protein
MNSEHWNSLSLGEQSEAATKQVPEVCFGMRDVLWTLAENSKPLDQRLRECLHWLEVQGLIKVNGQNVWIEDPEGGE